MSGWYATNGQDSVKTYLHEIHSFWFRKYESSRYMASIFSYLRTLCEVGTAGLIIRLQVSLLHCKPN